MLLLLGKRGVRGEKLEEKEGGKGIALADLSVASWVRLGKMRAEISSHDLNHFFSYLAKYPIYSIICSISQLHH